MRKSVRSIFFLRGKHIPEYSLVRHFFHRAHFVPLMIVACCTNQNTSFGYETGIRRVDFRFTLLVNIPK